MNFFLDETSLLLACDPKSPLKNLEALLAVKGLTLGYLPGRPVRTVGEALVGRVPNLLGERYGEIDEICVCLKARLKGGTVQTKNVPRSATGPDFKRLLASDGGRLLEVVLRASPRPEARERVLIRWGQKRSVGDFLKRFWASGIRPAYLRPKGTRALEIGLEGFSDIVRTESSELRLLARTTQGVFHART